MRLVGSSKESSLPNHLARMYVVVMKHNCDGRLNVCANSHPNMACWKWRLIDVNAAFGQREVVALKR